jgi:hypothetical protein
MPSASARAAIARPCSQSSAAGVTRTRPKRRLQPIPPSADWRLDLAEGCPAHCQYCYLAGSLAVGEAGEAVGLQPHGLDAERLGPRRHRPAVLPVQRRI